MGIRMMPEQFPEHRRQDPKKAAEAKVFDALLDLGLNGYGLYEFRFRREGKQVDNPLWVPSLGRFAVQVKGGTYEMDHRGQWFLATPDGTRIPVQSPLEEAADGCMELRDGIRMATTFGNFVAGVVIFTDMEPDDEIGHMARERYHVSVIWGLDSLQQDLERVADAVQGAGLGDEGRRVGELLRFLRTKGVIAGYGQAALLPHSVKDTVSGPYLDGLELAGVPARCELAGHAGMPAGDRLLVTTIHQAKGREWDVVVAGSLGGPDLETDRVGRNLAKYCGADAGEPAERIGDFDRARRHYVAFTRARNLLVLTASGELRDRFRSIWEGVAHWPWVDRQSLARQRFGAAGAEPPRVVEIDRLERLVVSLMKSGPVVSMTPEDWAAVAEESQTPPKDTPEKTPQGSGSATARGHDGLTGA